MVRDELEKRGYKIRSFKNANEYFGDDFENLMCFSFRFKPFAEHHNEGYLLQCFYNLQEKYERGQRDFSESEYLILEHFVDEEVYGEPVQNDSDFLEALQEFVEGDDNTEKYQEFAEMVLNNINESNVELLNLIHDKMVNIRYLRSLFLYFKQCQFQDRKTEEILKMYNENVPDEDMLTANELVKLFKWFVEEND